MADLLSVSSLHRRQVPADQRGLERILRKKVGRAIVEHEMISDGDRIMVCVSGGKDSYGLLDVLIGFRAKAPVSFELVAVNVDQGWPGYRTDLIEAHLASRDVERRMVNETEIAAIVEAKLGPDQTPCSLCSRMRRGVLYNLAVELGATKIALGHHADDLIETLVLNMMYSGTLAAMPAVLRSDDGRNTIIRPLCYVPEAVLEAYSGVQGYPVVRCACPSCGLPEQKRQVVKRMLGGLDEADPGIKNRMLAALGNVKPSQLLDRELQKLSRISP